METSSNIQPRSHTLRMSHVPYRTIGDLLRHNLPIAAVPAFKILYGWIYSVEENMEI